MAHAFVRDRFTWLAYLLLALYGYFLNVLGPITPYLKEELHLSYTVSSLHFTAFALGILLVGLVSHGPIRRLGRWCALWAGATGLSLGAVLLLAGRVPALTIAAAFFMGLVGSLILAVVPAALADRHGPLRAVVLSEANVVASLVATGAPLFVGWAAGAHLPGGWRLALGTAAAAPLLLFLVLGRGAAAGATPPAPAAPAPTRRPLPVAYWVHWLALMLAVSVEFCMVFWSADYLEQVLGLPTAGAARAVSLFLGGMIAGRLAGSRLVPRFSPRAVVSASILLAGLGFVLFWATGSPAAGLAGLFLTGLGVGNLYPLILSLALDASGAQTVQGSARATLASGTAILALPLALGRLADATGIRPAYGLVVVLLLAIFLTGRLAARLAARQDAVRS